MLLPFLPAPIFDVLAAPPSSQEPFHFLHFSIALPKGFAIADISNPEIDFDIFEIRDSASRCIARLYAGNHPSTKLVPLHPRNISKGVSLKYSVSAHDSSNFEMILRFQGLTYRRGESPWTYLHLFNVKSDPEIQKILTTALTQITIYRLNID